MSHTITIGALGADEWLRWKTLRLASLAEAPYAFGSTLAEALTFSDDDWRAQLLRGPYFVAERDGHDVGIVRLAPGDRADCWWLYSLWIDPVVRGTGLVEELLGAAESLARDHGASRLRLDVTRENHRALAVYLRRGYEVIGEVNEPDEAPEITLERQLL